MKFFRKELDLVRSFRLRLFNAFRVHGLIGTTFRLVRYPLLRMRWANVRGSIFGNRDTAEVFTRIYETNWWGSEESVSGSGSTLEYTANLRQKLPELISDFSITTVFDAPCGDFNWMQHVIRPTELQYHGADIVPKLIHENREKYRGPRIEFSVLDVIRDDLPKADLWICRDCLIHFSFADILRTFENFMRSDINYMLTTTHVNRVGFKNINISTGDVRVIDLFSAPFFLSKNYHYAIDDWLEPDLPRKLILFSRDQIRDALPKMREVISNLPPGGA